MGAKQSHHFIPSPNSEKYGKDTPSKFEVWLADMDLEFPTPLRRRFDQISSADSNNFAYRKFTDSQKQNIADWFSSTRSDKTTSYVVDKSHVFESPSIWYGWFITLLAFTLQNDYVLTFTPGMRCFFTIPQRLKRKPVVSEMKDVRDDGHKFHYQICWEDLQDKMKTYRPKIFAFGNPMNPTGKIFTRQELQRIRVLCEKYDILVFSDQIFSDLTLRNTPVTFYPSVSEQKNSATSAGANFKVIVGNTVSKAFNVSALQAGYVLIPDPDIARKYSQMQHGLMIFMTHYAMLANQVCYEPSGKGKEWLEMTRKLILSNYDRLCQICKKLGFQVSSLEAGYLVVVRPKEGRSENQVREYLKGRSIAFSGLDNFYYPPRVGTGQVRISIAMPKKAFGKLIETLQKPVARL